MKPNFLQDLIQFSTKNFNFNPCISPKKSNSKNSTSTNDIRLIDLKFPNEEMSNLFCYECLSFLLKNYESFRTNKEKLIKDTLIVIYNFYEGNKNAIDYLDILDYAVPFKKDESFQICFNKKEDFNSFLLFNLLLMNYYNIDNIIYERNSFTILEILLLYDYAFIRDNVKDKKAKQAISKVIQILMNNYINSSGENDIIIKA